MKISVVSLGKSGSSIAQNWKPYTENTFFINTHQGEMKLLPGDFFDEDANYNHASHKRLVPHKLCIDGRGTGRSPKTGRLLAEQNYKVIEKFLTHNLTGYRGLILVLVGGGGGSGTGFAPVVCDIMHKMGLNFGVIYTLPLENEGIPTIPNAINGLTDLTTVLDSKKVAPFFLVDNDLMIEDMETGENFWGNINERITKIMLFLSLTDREITDISTFNTLDEREFIRMFRLTKRDGSVGFNDIKSFPLDIDDVVNSYKDGMKQVSSSFVRGYDYPSAEGLLVAVEQPEDHDDDTEQLNELFDLIASKFKGKQILKSVVTSDEYRVNILFSGLNTPVRVKKLNEITKRLLASGKEKRKEKAKMGNVRGFNDTFEDFDL